MVSSRIAAASLAALLIATTLPARAAEPPWLALRVGTVARVDLAPWPLDLGPEAALAASVDSIERFGSDELGRPEDALHRPVGVRIAIVRLLPDRIALVRGIGAGWRAYARVERLVPEVPAGTALRAAGGFAGFADFFPSLDARVRGARQLPTGTALVAIATGIAPFDPDASELVRLKVRIMSGERKGATGWVDVGYTGIPVPAAGSASTAEKACRCRLVAFGDSAE